MPPVAQILVFGDVQFKHRLRSAERRVTNMRPVLETIATDMMRVIRMTFFGQGRRFGGSWHFLETDTLRRKVGEGQDPRILIATGALMDSFTKRGDENQELRVDHNSITLDSRLPYAGVHQFGSDDGHIPARPYINFYPQDKRRWAKLITNDIMEALNGR